MVCGGCHHHSWPTRTYLANAIILAVELPEGVWRGEFAELQSGFGFAEKPRTIVKYKTAAVTTEGKGCIQCIAVGQGLLHAALLSLASIIGMGMFFCSSAHSLHGANGL